MGKKIGSLSVFISLFCLGFFGMSVSVENPDWDFLAIGIFFLLLGIWILRKTHKKIESKRFQTVRRVFGNQRNSYEYEDDDYYDEE